MFIYLLLINFLFPQAAMQTHGSWNAEWGIFHNVSLNDPQHSNKNYMVQRFSLNPELIINDNVQINSKWLFVGAIGQNNIQINRDGQDAGYIFGSSNYGISIIPNELYLNWRNDYFTLKVGRQAFGFGLGIFKNKYAYTDVVDRVVFNFPFDTVYLKAGVDILQNLNIDNLSDTHEALFFEAGYKQDAENIEMAFLWYKMFETNNSTIYDIYLKKSFPLISLDIKLETLYRDINSDKAFAFAIDTNWENNNFQAGIKTGLATGDSSETITNHTFSFSPGYQVAMLLFKEDLGTGANIIYSQEGVGGAYDGLGAFYLSPNISYKWNKFTFSTAFTYAQTQKTPTSHVSKILGYEIDLNVNYEVYDNFNTYIKTALLKPGTFFAGNDIAFGILVGLETSF